MIKKNNYSSKDISEILEFLIDEKEKERELKKKNKELEIIKEAIITLADCVDRLEDLHLPDVKRPEFRTRKKLIEDILKKK